MIRVEFMEVENFRSIIGKPLRISFSNFTAIVGPNNCGKSNILRALQLFFTGAIEGALYSTENDFPKNVYLSRQAQTKITITIKLDPDKDVLIKRAIDELEANSKQKKLDNNQVTLRLSYSKNGVESWQYIGKLGALNIGKELIHKVRDGLRQSVIFKYIPVGRDSLESITREIGAELIRTIFSGWSGAVRKRKEINDSISAMISKLQPELVDSSKSVTSSMSRVFHDIEKLELQLPFENLEEMLPNLRPVIKDTAETGLRSKGAGIQTSSLLFLLKFLADNHPQRYMARQTFVWAIEEPESFLHPNKQRAMAKVLLDFSSEVQSVVTTHCSHFVPRSDSVAACYVVDKSEQEPWSTEVVGQDYLLARQTLGVTLLDSMSLFPINLIVEGPSDEIYFSEALKMLSEKLSIKWHDVKFFPSGNASGAANSFEWMVRQADSSTCIKLIIDGDKAGTDALNGLLSRGRRDGILWKSNHDYFQLPNDVESLLPDRVKILLYDERPAQVQLVQDTNGNVKSFKALDTHKKAVAARAMELIKVDELGNFFALFQKIERASIGVFSEP